jgi:hypothetical protein
MRRISWAIAAGAIGVLLLFLVPVASSADESVLAGLDLVGTARGLQINFGFQDFVIEKLVDIGIPHASTELSSEGGGQARAVASQVFPGDLIAGVGGEQIPGYREANYPAGKDTEARDANDDTDTVSALFQQDFPHEAGPISFDASRLETFVSETVSRAEVTTHKLALNGADGPLLEFAKVLTSTDANGEKGTIVQQSQATISNISLSVPGGVTVKIGQLRSTARSGTDGTEGRAVASMVISDVEVIAGTQHIRASIDQDGIHLEGIEGAPGEIPQSLSRHIGTVLDQAGIDITTSNPVEIVEGAAASSSVGGLLIQIRGRTPSVFTPDAAGAIIDQIQQQIPTRCFRELEPQQIFANFPVPLCFSSALIPLGGAGMVTSFAIGQVSAAADAAKPFTPAGPGDGGFNPGGFGNGGGIVPPAGPGFVPPPTFNGGGGGPQQQPPSTGPLTGRVAKMNPGAILGAGVAFIIFAIALAIGPSLRRWQPTEAP